MFKYFFYHYMMLPNNAIGFKLYDSLHLTWLLSLLVGSEYRPNCRFVPKVLGFVGLCDSTYWLDSFGHVTDVSTVYI